MMRRCGRELCSLALTRTRPKTRDRIGLKNIENSSRNRTICSGCSGILSQSSSSSSSSSTRLDRNHSLPRNKRTELASSTCGGGGYDSNKAVTSQFKFTHGAGQERPRVTLHHSDDNRGLHDFVGSSNSSGNKQAAEHYERHILWQAARNFRQTDHYDHSLFGFDIDLDRAVARHQREAMQYNQGGRFYFRVYFRSRPRVNLKLFEMASGGNSEEVGADEDTGSTVSTFDELPPDDEAENEELIHERLHRERRKQRRQQRHRALQHRHRKELIKPDASEREAAEAALHQQTSPSAELRPAGAPLVATAVDEQQLHERLMRSVSEMRLLDRLATDVLHAPSDPSRTGPAAHMPRAECSSSSRETVSGAESSSTSTSSNREQTGAFDVTGNMRKSRSPPPRTIIIPASVARSVSQRSLQQLQQQQQQQQRQLSDLSTSASNSGTVSSSAASSTHRLIERAAAGASGTSQHTTGAITREQLEYGPLLKPNEVQLLYRAPELATDLDRHLKDEQAKQVAPNLRQSPIAIMSMNPSYELQNKPLRIEYPATVENLRLNNTGFSWEVKLPYQVSMTTALYGAHLNTTHRYRLDQFHCHWGRNEREGSEHTVDNCAYSAELHFVHYNMDKYHTLSKAARHPDGLVVLGVFVDANENHHNHAELEKICSQLKSVQLKGEHSIIKQAVRIENLLPSNRSYWSYQGSLTTPPYLESVTWFVLKNPIKCNTNQIRRFRSLKSTLRHDQIAPIRERRTRENIHRQGERSEGETDDDDKEQDDNYDGSGVFIRSNHRKTQPLNGRTIVAYEDQPSSSSNLAPR